VSQSEILELLPRLTSEQRREVLDRLLTLEAAESRESHQQWIDEALQSGPSLPATAADWENAFQRGLQRAGPGIPASV
jgi:hypothetical protein